MITLGNQGRNPDHMTETQSGFQRLECRLKSLSDREILGGLQSLNGKERKLKTAVLLYLAEFDRRRLYLPLGCGSLFDFCTSRLGYTEATAARRIRAARAAARFPEALEMLRAGEITITTLSMVHGILDKNILESIRNKSVREVEALVARRKPASMIRDGVKPVLIMKPLEQDPEPDPAQNNSKSTVSADSEQTIANVGMDIKKGSMNETDILKGGGKRVAGSTERVILEERLKISFSVKPEFMKKYNKIKSLLSSKHPEGIGFEALFDILMDEYLARHDPEKKQARRSRRQENPRETGNKKKNVSAPRKDREAGGRRSRIPDKIRNIIFARDVGRCTFVGAHGRRCNSTWDLEIDHVIPVARGGGDSPGNLRFLCRRHNIHQAERAFGEELMKNHRRRE